MADYNQEHDGQRTSDKRTRSPEEFNKVGGAQSSAQRPEEFRQAQAKTGGVHQGFKKFIKVREVQTSPKRPDEFRKAHAKAR